MSEKMVIDPSVAAKWFLKDDLESGTDLAEAILLAFLAGDLELYAPRIFTYEMGGLFAKNIHRRSKSGAQRLTKSDALNALNCVFSLPIHISEAKQEEEAKSLEKAVIFSKTYYDMCYITVAEERDCKWCTADVKILDGNSPDFPANRVQLLSDLY